MQGLFRAGLTVKIQCTVFSENWKQRTCPGSQPGKWLSFKFGGNPQLGPLFPFGVTMAKCQSVHKVYCRGKGGGGSKVRGVKSTFDYYSLFYCYEACLVFRVI